MANSAIEAALKPITDLKNRGSELVERTLDTTHINIGGRERWISVFTGSALTFAGLKMRSLPGLLLAGVGAAVAHRGWSGHCFAYAAMNKDGRGEPTPPEAYFERGIHVAENVTIDRSPEDLYRFWRKLENLPRVMSHLREVKPLDGNRSHWVAQAPAGLSIAWDAEIINDEKNELIAWRSLPGAVVDNAGSVRFAPTADGKSTELKVTIDYIAPGGRFLSTVARLFGQSPDQEVRADLARFKQIMEAAAEIGRSA